MSYIICVDIGSSRTKAALFRKNGHLVAVEAHSSHRRKSRALTEALPIEWLEATLYCIRRVARSIRKEDIIALIIASEGPTLVAVDRSLRPVAPALLWMDNRAVSEAKELSATTGKPVYPSWIPPKALWMSRNQNEVFKKVAWILQPLDYITSLFTGEVRFSVVSDVFNAAPHALWNATGLPDSLIPPEIVMGEIQGTLLPKWADEMGIRAGIPVVAGTGGVDAIQVILGTATLEEGLVCDKAGTAEGIEVVTDRMISDPRFFVAPHPIIPGKFHAGGMMSTTGKALDWFRECFYPGKTSWEYVLSEAGKANPGAGGLIFLPYLSGERTPIWDEKARGVFFGISQAHTRQDFARAVLEGVALGMDQIISILKSYGVAPLEMRTAGWPARSALWNQIKADVTGLPVRVSKVPEVELLGLAIIAGWAIGIYSDLREAALDMVRFQSTIYPRREIMPVYEPLKAVYGSLYQSLKPHFATLWNVGASDREACAAYE